MKRNPISSTTSYLLGGDWRIEAICTNIKMPLINNCIQIVIILVLAMKDCTS
jgi:hypothetical protein